MKRAGFSSAAALALLSSVVAFPSVAHAAVTTETHGPRSVRVFVPSKPTSPLSMVVMLHGCTQEPNGFADATQMDAVAEEKAAGGACAACCAGRSSRRYAPRRSRAACAGKTWHARRLRWPGRRPALRDTRRMTDADGRRPLRVLHLEDSDLDHELAMAHLQRAGLRVQAQRIESRAEFAEALHGDWDLILSDYNLPGFSGLQALDMLRDSGRLLPFILVSGEIGEDTAVEAMRNGASDYLLKNNLARLAPAMEHAIEAAEARRARLAADEEVQASRQRLAELAQHLQTSVEQERSAIAREIHDDVGGSLTALKFDLAWIARHAGGEPLSTVFRAQPFSIKFGNVYDTRQVTLKGM